MECEKKAPDTTPNDKQGIINNTKYDIEVNKRFCIDCAHYPIMQGISCINNTIPSFTTPSCDKFEEGIQQTTEQNNIDNVVKKATCKICPVFDRSGFCYRKNKANDENTAVCNLYGKYASPKTEKTNIIETPQHIKDKANEILKSGDPVKFIFDIHQRYHVGDPVLSLARIAAVGNQSALNTRGIQPAADGESGKGKSDGDKKFAHLLPSEYVLLGTVSDKVLYYMKELKAGTYICSDDVNLSEDLTSTIKRATSNFQQKTPYHTLDKDRGVISNELPERLVFALNSVDATTSLQLINRQFNCSVDESHEQDERVFEYQQIEGMIGQDELPINDDVLTCREIFREIKKHLFRVAIPYNYLIEWTDIENRRNFPMFEDMIRGFAVYFFKQREMHDNILFADFSDFERAIQLYTKRTEQQGRKLTDAELRLILAISKEDHADIKTLMKATGLSQGRISQLMKGKGKDNDSGLIHKVKGLHCEDETITTGTGAVKKKFYSISNFNPEAYKNPVVWIDDIAKDEFSRYYHDITTILLSKIKDSNHDITYITFNNNIHSNKKYNELLGFVLFGKNSKRGNNGNNVATDAEQKGNNVGNSVGNNATILPSTTILPQNTAIEIVIPILKEKFDKINHSSHESIMVELMVLSELNNIDDTVLEKIVSDYCKLRGW